MTAKSVYRVVFQNQGKLYELYARHVGQSDMLGFIEVGDLIFGERSALLVDPAEEKLKSEFAGVRRTYLPMHSVLRIDQVDKEGNNKVTDLPKGDTVTPFPTLFPTGGHPGSKT